AVLLFFSLFSRPPPRRSTLFPYTTLFRSGTNVSSQARQGRASPRHLQTPRFKRIQVWRELADSRRAGLQDDELEPLAQEAPTRRDRKSTRLNSSHDQISYAVFCLKKKRTT